MIIPKKKGIIDRILRFWIKSDTKVTPENIIVVLLMVLGICNIYIYGISSIRFTGLIGCIIDIVVFLYIFVKNIIQFIYFKYIKTLYCDLYTNKNTTSKLGRM